MKNFLKSVFAKMVLVVALVLIGVMIYSATSGGFSTIPETIGGTVITPLQSVVTSVSDGVSGLFGRLFGTSDLHQRVTELEEENAALRQRVADYDELKQKNDWYGEILGLHEEHSDYTFASGRVIGRDPSDIYGNFTISAGTNADITVNDPVVATDGTLIGVVEEVSLTYSRVRTILDPAIRVSAQISRTGDAGYTMGSDVTKARDRICRLTTLERTSGVSIGDYAVTSGIGGVYPGGLLIGTVHAIGGAADGMTLEAEVELFADIYSLKQVMVITSFDGQLSETSK